MRPAFSESKGWEGGCATKGGGLGAIEVPDGVP